METKAYRYIGPPINCNLEIIDAEATVFAPTDAAFVAMDQALLSKLLTPAFNPHLVDLIFYHIISGMTVMAADIIDGSFVIMLSDEEIFLEKSMDGSVTINDNVNVVQADVKASNGVVHVIDQVLLPDWILSTYQYLADRIDYSTFVSLIDDAMLADAWNGPGPFTIFAPSNDALDAALVANPDLDITGISLMSIILQTHIVDEIIYSGDIEDGMEVTALSGEILVFEVMVDGNITVNGVPIPIDDADALVNNGVVHGMQDVILPTLPARTATTSAPIAAPTSSALGHGTFIAAASAMASCVAITLFLKSRAPFGSILILMFHHG